MNSLLKELREKNELTQAEVALYLGVDQSLIAKMESGERNVSVSQLELLSSLYGYDIIKNDNSNIVKIAYRAKNVSNDLVKIARIKKIALNLRFMEGLKNVK